MILTPRAFYPMHTAGAARWGMTLLADQQLAGLLISIPAGFVYLGAAWASFVAWMKQAEQRQTKIHRLSPALGLAGAVSDRLHLSENLLARRCLGSRGRGGPLKATARPRTIRVPLLTEGREFSRSFLHRPYRNTLSRLVRHRVHAIRIVESKGTHALPVRRAVMDIPAQQRD